MHFSIRATFAAVLWIAALVPPGLYLVHLDSPESAVAAAKLGAGALRWVLLGAGGVVLVLLLLYPPFLPATRIAFRRLRMRLGTDLGPLREAEARLRHLETAADHLVAGRVLFQQRRMGDALNHLQRAVELDPQHAGSHYQLGLVLAKVGHLQAAVEHLRAAVHLDEKHAFGAAMLELGVVLERGNANEAAIEVFERHQELFGFQRRARFHCARARAREGQREAALEDLREAAKPADDGRKLTLEEDLVRAQAKVALLRGGRL